MVEVRVCCFSLWGGAGGGGSGLVASLVGVKTYLNANGKMEIITMTLLFS